MLGLIGALRHPQPTARAGRSASAPAAPPAGSARFRRWSASTSSSSSRSSLDVARASAAVNHDVLTQPEGAHHHRRRARDAADQPRALRPHRLGAVEPVSAPASRACSRRSSTARRATADRRRRVRPMGAGLRDRRADAAHRLRDARVGVSARRNVADRRPATSCWSRRSSRAPTVAAALPRASPKEPYKSALANAWRAVDLNGLLAHFLATDALARAIAATPRRRDQHRRSQRRRVRPGAIGRPRRPMLIADLRSLAESLGASRAGQPLRHRLVGRRDRLGQLRRVGAADNGPASAIAAGGATAGRVAPVLPGRRSREGA